MPTKILRLGFTESSLLFIYWMNHHKNINNDNLMMKSKNDLIKWLYTTSGYYDKTQSGNYFNVVHCEEDTDIYKKYMNIILDFIKNSDICTVSLHKFSNETYIEDFKKMLNPKKYQSIFKETVFDFIKNKKILIVSPFSKLMKSQIDTGNWKHIYPNAPTLVNSYIYTFPYTFFNNGPHNNILETSEYIFNNIIETIEEEYDSVLISCGAYSCLIAKQFYDIGKNVLTIGGELTKYLGIISKRVKEEQINNKEYWINIPEEYKPNDYIKIENGCYW